MQVDDKQLINEFVGGNTSAYETLFDRYQSKIYNYAYNIVGNKEDAKDVAQEAFIKVFEALPNIKGDLNFSAYLYKTAHNKALDELRKKKRLASPDAIETEEDPDLNVSPQKTAMLKAQQVKVREAAMNLSEEYREVLTLREIDDQSYDEIAEVMNIPRNSVGVLLLRARLKFKKVFRMSHVDVEKLSKQCKDMLPLLSGYIDKELNDAEKERVSDHLKDCPLCRLALEEMTESSKRYRALIPLLVPLALKTDAFAHINDLAKTANASSDISSAGSQTSQSEAPTVNMQAKTGGASDAQTVAINKSSVAAKSSKAAKSASAANRGLFSRLRSLSTTKKMLLAAFFLVFLSGSVLVALYGVKQTGLIPIQSSKLDQQVPTAKPSKINEKESAEMNKAPDETKPNNEASEEQPQTGSDEPAEEETPPADEQQQEQDPGTDQSQDEAKPGHEQQNSGDPGSGHNDTGPGSDSGTKQDPTI